MIFLSFNRPINYVQNEETSQRAKSKGPADFVEYFFDQVHASSPVNLDFISWIKECSKLPVIAKGILSGT